MGSVKIDIHRNEYQWHHTNFSDFQVIKGLLKFRNQYDMLNNIEAFEDDPRVIDFNKEIICIYVSLDDIIKKTKLNEKQLNIINLYQEGYTENDIAFMLNISQQNVHKVIKTSIKRIQKQAANEWLYDYFLWNKKKTNENWLYCKKCLSWKPQAHFYFDKTNQSYKNFCKNC